MMIFSFDWGMPLLASLGKNESLSDMMLVSRLHHSRMHLPKGVSLLELALSILDSVLRICFHLPRVIMMISRLVS